MSNIPESNGQELQKVHAQLIEQAKATGKLTTEELVAALTPLGVDMSQMEDTYHALSEAGIEVLTEEEYLQLHLKEE